MGFRGGGGNFSVANRSAMIPIRASFGFACLKSIEDTTFQWLFYVSLRVLLIKQCFRTMPSQVTTDSLECGRDGLVLECRFRLLTQAGWSAKDYLAFETKRR